ncbi:MAG: hypothetical protein PUP92_30550 [Rhizonema sp. PD38]|nr:hypothetical protein [Rhizonema sp. PD38]
MEINTVHLLHLPKNMNLSQDFLQQFQQAKDFLDKRVNSLTESAQLAGESLKETATQASDRAVNTVTTNLEQAKASLQQTVKTADQIKSTTSEAIQTAIASSINNWLSEHPRFLQLLQLLNWAINHPIISLIILLFTLALVWNIIKAIGRLIELASLSILRVPLKFLQAVISFSLSFFSNLGSLAVKQLRSEQKSDKTLLALPATTSQSICKEQQQKLAEISQRLEEIQTEQNELLQQAAVILAEREGGTTKLGKKP